MWLWWRSRSPLAANGLALLAPEPGLAIGARAFAGVGTALGFVAGIDYVRSQGGSPFAQGLYGGVGLSGGGHRPGRRAPRRELDRLAGSVRVDARGRSGRPALHYSPARLTPPALGLQRHETTSVSSVVRDRRLYGICLVYAASFGLAVVLGAWVVVAADQSRRLQRCRGGRDRITDPARRHREPPVRRMAGTDASDTRDAGRRRAATSRARSAPRFWPLRAPSPSRSSGHPCSGWRPAYRSPPAFAAAARIRPDAPAVASGMVNAAANVLIIVCHAAARARLLAPGGRPDRLRGRHGALAGGRPARRRRSGSWVRRGRVAGNGSPAARTVARCRAPAGPSTLEPAVPLTAGETVRKSLIIQLLAIAVVIGALAFVVGFWIDWLPPLASEEGGPDRRPLRRRLGDLPRHLRDGGVRVAVRAREVPGASGRRRGRKADPRQHGPRALLDGHPDRARHRHRRVLERRAGEERGPSRRRIARST